MKFKKQPFASDGSRLFLCRSEDVFALLSVFSSSAAEKTPPDFRNGKSGGVDALLVLSQALTQLLAGVLDGSLSGSQNYRAFGFAVVRCLHFKQAIKHIILNPAADVVLQAAAHKPNT